MKSQSLISVIVPVYNVEDYLDECVESIVKQTYTNLEILLIDDGSTDSSGKKCDTWAHIDARIQVIHKENGGLSDARNVGLDKCNGDYITFVDSDDYVDKLMIERLYEVLINEEADCVSACMFEFNNKMPDDRVPERPYISCTGTEALNLLFQEKGPTVSAWGKLFRIELWNNVRFPFDKYYEDAFTTYKIFLQCSKVVQIPECLYGYRMRHGSISHSKFSLKYLDLQEAWKENYLFCKKYYPELEDVAHVNWLTYLPDALAKFPKVMTEDEKKAKTQLKNEILKNLPFMMSQHQSKKLYHHIKALFG